MAAVTKNPSLKESLTDLAKRWARLATELEATRILFEKVGRFSVTTKTGPISMTARPVVEQLAHQGGGKKETALGGWS